MPRLPSPNVVTEEGADDHVRFRDPGRFDGIRTPEYATTVADAVSAGSTDRMGRLAGSGNGKGQFVLIPTGISKPDARRLPERIMKRIGAD